MRTLWLLALVAFICMIYCTTTASATFFSRSRISSKNKSESTANKNKDTGKNDERGSDKDKAGSGKTGWNKDKAESGKTGSDKDKAGSGKTGSDKDKARFGKTGSDKDKAGSGKTGSDKDKTGSGKTRWDKDKAGSGKTGSDKDKAGSGNTWVDKIKSVLNKSGSDKNKSGSNKSGSDKNKSGSGKTGVDKIKSGSGKSGSDKNKSGSGKTWVDKIKSVLNKSGSDKSNRGSDKSGKGNDKSSRSKRGTGASEDGTQNCIDLDLASINLKFASTAIKGCKKVKSITLNNQASRTKCEFGKNFGFDGDKVFVDNGCRGNFRVCYDLDEDTQLAEQEGDTTCVTPFRSILGKCIYIESNSQRSHESAAERCAAVGGRLPYLPTPVVVAAASGATLPFLKGRKFFVGGITDVASFIQTPYGKNIITRYRIRAGDEDRCFRRFLKGATVTDMNTQSSLSSKCMVLDFDNVNGISVEDCDARLNYICESVQDENAGKWTPWINSNTPDGRGEEEDLNQIARLIERGRLQMDKGRMCKNPVGMQCRDVKTQTLYSRANTNGLNLDSPCERNRIRCRNWRQTRGQTCPDFEVRFQCPDEAVNDCSVESVRHKCEQRRRECQDTTFGPVCVRKRRERTGREKIGEGTCDLNSQTYRVYECTAWGDPHYITPDGSKFDFQGVCSYNLISTCNNYVGTDYFPSFSIVSRNEKNNPSDPVSITRGFNLEIEGAKYTFYRGDFYVGGLKRSPVGYTDDFLRITGDPRGNAIQLTIDTDYCMKINWDGSNRITVQIPDYYMGHICGLCGNFDGDRSNDMTIPGRNGTVDEVTLGKFHTVGGAGSETCVDQPLVPPPCSEENKAKYGGKTYCGVLDPSQNSPFVSAVLDLSDVDVRSSNREKLQNTFNDCVNDHCWLTQFVEGRCQVLETIISEIRLALAINDDTLDAAWRNYADCTIDVETTCNGRPNMVYNAAYLINCQNTCQNPIKSLLCDDQTTSQGCVCKDGFYLDAELNCVPAESCDSGCSVSLATGEDITLNDGDTIVVEPCRKTVTCNAGTINETTTEGCSEHGECSADGHTCSCKQGYKGDGRTCIPNRACRSGYIAQGTKCYKLVRERLPWHSAAINCGADGGQLARYDADVDLELENFFQKLGQLYLLSIGKSRLIKCRAGNTCCAPTGELILSVKVGDPADIDECADNILISEDKKHIAVGAACTARYFIIETVEARLANMDLCSMDVWIGGNTNVIGPNKRDGKAPYQVDPPRLVDVSAFQNSVGCFVGNTNADSVFIAKPIPDCESQLPSVCEYENTGQTDYDPLDFRAIRQRVNIQEAISLCAELGRPLATISSKAQLERAQKVLSDSGGDGWLSLRYVDGQFSWGTGQPLTDANSNFRRTPDPAKNGREYHCVSMDSRRGTWDTEMCSSDFYPLCGPPGDGATPLTFSPFYPVDGFSSLPELKQKLQRENKKDYICNSPSMIECSAETLAGRVYVDQNNQQGQTIVCRADRIVCNKGQELDCNTFRVRFLCPNDENQCTELVALGATPCDGGRDCFPISNHYICKCPPGSQYSELSNTCATYCGECSLWGDPHYTLFNNMKYDFMGVCKYLLAGVCNLEEYGPSPSFQIFSKNKLCGSDSASCINELEVVLHNIPTVVSGAEIRKDYVFRAYVGASGYLLNDNWITQTEYTVPGIFTAVVKSSYFSLVVNALDLSLLLSGTKFKVSVPGQFSHKMCGLCGDCGSDLFRLPNGTYVDPDTRRNTYDKRIMATLATLYAVHDAEAETEECEIPEPSEEKQCSDELKAVLDKPNLCGVFHDETSPINNCLNQVAELDRENYYNSCMFDVCNQDDPQASVCAMVKALAQECLGYGFPLDWRTDTFCPMTCPPGTMYRADASCEPTCGQSAVSRQVCEEEPEEGCVCFDGKMKQGDKCVPESECGCKVYLNEDSAVWNLAPGETIVLPDCQETVTCEVEADGTNSLRHAAYTLSPYAICNPEFPVTVECAKGFVMAEDGKTCQKDPDGCLQGFEDMDGLCISIPPDTKIWRQAVEACNEADGTLVLVDTDTKLASLKTVMQDNGYNSLYISGRVKATKGPDGNVLFENVLSDAQEGTVEWANFDVHASLLDNIILSSDYGPDDLPAGGKVFSLVARLDEEQVLVIAVDSKSPSNFVCEQRNVEEKDTAWFGPCNTDDNMADDGDQEDRYDMLLDPDCLICPVPMDVRCERNPNAMNAGTVDGECALNANGIYYSCSQGQDCIDKSVSTKCAKDVDECATGRDDCPANSVCINTAGAYMCKCNEAFPLMVNGECQEADTCTMTGPATPLDYIYNLNGFSDVPALFGYDCQFKLAYMCDRASSDESGVLPYVAFYVLSTRRAGALQPYLGGVIYDPTTGKTKRWLLSPDLLSQGRIKYGEDGADLVESSLSFPDRDVHTRFQFVSGTLVIRHFKNYFKATISFPTRIRLDFSQDYRDMMCGACTVQPDAPGADIVLSADEVDSVSFTSTSPCTQGSPPATSPPPTTPAETTPTETTLTETTPAETTPAETTPAETTPTETTPAKTTPTETTPTETTLTETTPAETTPAETTPTETTLTTTPPPPVMTYGPTTTPPPPVMTYGPTTTPPGPVMTYGPTNSPPGPVMTYGPTSGPTEGPPTSSCDEDTVNICAKLNTLCNVPQSDCQAALCNANVNVCSYLSTATITSCTVGTDLRAFLMTANCDYTCGPNMRFRYTVLSSQPTCSDPFMQPTISESSDEDGTFTCVCNEGYVLSGIKCVRPASCGCVMPGRYLPPGTQWRDSNCSYVYTCLGGDQINTEDSPCGDNTLCVNTDRGPTCLCHEDFYGNPDMPSGCQPGREDESGSKTCYDYTKFDGSVEERCDCNMGYVSNCEDCEDIDECQESLHDCDLSMTKCVNVAGGYECVCREGYREVNGECRDVNECRDPALNECEENSECVNTDGSYECICCAGYVYNPADELCERDTIGFPNLPANASCCAICNNKQLCDESIVSPTPYCYTSPSGEKKQYPSYLVMYVNRCLNSQVFNNDEFTRGRCPRESSPPPSGVTTGPPSTQVPLPGSCDSPSLCDSVPPPPPSLSKGPVCGPTSSNPQTFPSYCDMVKAVCVAGGGPPSLPTDSTIAAYPGPCVGKGRGKGAPPPIAVYEPIFTPWSPFSPCQFDSGSCGTGEQIRNRQVAPYDDDRLVRPAEPFETRDTRPCFKPCPEEQNTTNPESSCPDPAFCSDIDPVCGTIGYGSAATFYSECELQVIACLNGGTPNVLYAGDCDESDEPENGRFCDTGPRVESIKYDAEVDDLHCVGEVVRIGSCGDLLCEGEAATCCKATDFERIQVDIDCYNLSSKQFVKKDKHIYFSATHCECQAGSGSGAGPS